MAVKTQAQGDNRTRMPVSMNAPPVAARQQALIGGLHDDLAGE